jgi:hypothetical protein
VDANAQFRSFAKPWADTGTSIGRLMIAVPGGPRRRGARSYPHPHRRGPQPGAEAQAAHGPSAEVDGGPTGAGGRGLGGQRNERLIRGGCKKRTEANPGSARLTTLLKRAYVRPCPSRGPRRAGSVRTIPPRNWRTPAVGGRALRTDEKRIRCSADAIQVQGRERRLRAARARMVGAPPGPAPASAPHYLCFH